MQKGGILIISKDDANIYNKLQIALTQGKPVLWYETPTECYYIDTISGGEITTEIVDDVEVTTYGDIILTKGGKTITITDANVVTETGGISIHKYIAYIEGETSGSDLYNIYLTLITTKENPTINDFINTLGYEDNDAYVIVRLSNYVEEDNKVEFKSANGSDIVLEIDVEFTITKEF